MIYLDSCLVIYLMEDPDSRGAHVRAAIRRHAETDFATSWLTYLECLVRPFANDDVTVRRGYERFLDQLVSLSLGRDVFVRAARVRAESGLRTPDAIHLAVALTSGCLALWTNDNRLARASGDLAVNVLG